MSRKEHRSQADTIVAPSTQGWFKPKPNQKKFIERRPHSGVAVSDIEDDAASIVSTEAGLPPKKRPTTVTNLRDKIFRPGKTKTKTPTANESDSEGSVDWRRTAVHRRRVRVASPEPEVDKKPSKSGKSVRFLTMLALLGLAGMRSDRKQALDAASSGYDSGDSMYSDSSLAASPPPRRRRGRSGFVEVTEHRKSPTAPSSNTYPAPVQISPASRPPYPETQRRTASQRARTSSREPSRVLKRREDKSSSAANTYDGRSISRASRSPRINLEHPMPIDSHKPKAASQSTPQSLENSSSQAKVQYERPRASTKARTSVPFPDRTRPRSLSKGQKRLETPGPSARRRSRSREPSGRANADKESILSPHPHANISSEHQKTGQTNKPHIVEENQAKAHPQDPPILIARDVPSRLRNNDLVQDSKLDTVLIDHDGNSVQHTLYKSSHRTRRRPRKIEETWKRREKIGSGTFGKVWLQECVDGENIGRFRAVKEIAKEKCEDGSVPIEYNRELEAIAKFSQSKYVHCFARSHGWYENSDTIFITMEYFENGDLQRYLNRPFPEPEAKEIVYQILEGLRFMHKNSFAHRDLKPANILVSEASPNWWVKISDFGISKRAEQESTAFRTFAGTRGYLAPEVMAIYPPDEKIREKGSKRKDMYTNAVDLWALGVIMFQLLTTQVVMKDPHKLWEYVNENQPFPEEILDKHNVSSAAKTLVKRLMAPSPGRRPSASSALNYEWFTDLDDSSEPKHTNEEL